MASLKVNVALLQQGESLLFSPIEETCVLLCLCVQIREELRANGIDVYPQKEFDEDAEDRLINDKIRVS